MKKNNKIKAGLQVLLVLGILIFINIIANMRVRNKSLYSYIDLTEDQRYSLTPGTQKLLNDLDEVIYVRVLLEGDFPAGFKRLQAATRDMLDDFRSESGYIEYKFENPNEGSVQEINDRRKRLADEGIQPVKLNIRETDGSSNQYIYPFAIFYYKGRSVKVNLLESEAPGMPQQLILNNSIKLLEYRFANAITTLQNTYRQVIAFTTGHGELNGYETADLEKSLREFYDTGRMHLDSITAIDTLVSVLVVAKPRGAFSEKDKFKIDQYVMNGGKVLWLIDHVNVNLDSLKTRTKDYYPSIFDTNLDDQLFKYGIRIQPNLIMDMQASHIPLVVGFEGNEPQFENFKYPYHIVSAPSHHPITANVGPVNLLYANSIDTIRTKTKIKKTTLLSSSENSTYKRLPAGLNFQFLQKGLNPAKFNKGPQKIAVLLEGTFPSLYENRVDQSMKDALATLGQDYKSSSVPNRMIVVSDGDIAKNEFNQKSGSFKPLGFNSFEKYTFANKDFLINAIEYLINPNGVITARGKEVKLRLLNSVKAKKEKQKWQLINIGLPLLFLLIFGLIYNLIRRQKFGR